MDTTISLPEASKLAAVSQTTVRRWIKSGTIEAKTDKAGKWKIRKQTLLNKLATNPPRMGASLEAPAGQQVEDSPLYIQTLEALRRERQLNDELRSENKKLNAEIKALLAQRSEKSIGSVISRWIRSS